MKQIGIQHDRPLTILILSDVPACHALWLGVAESHRLGSHIIETVAGSGPSYDEEFRYQQTVTEERRPLKRWFRQHLNENSRTSDCEAIEPTETHGGFRKKRSCP